LALSQDVKLRCESKADCFKSNECFEIDCVSNVCVPTVLFKCGNGYTCSIEGKCVLLPNVAQETGDEQQQDEQQQQDEEAPQEVDTNSNKKKEENEQTNETPQKVAEENTPKTNKKVNDDDEEDKNENKKRDFDHNHHQGHQENHHHKEDHHHHDKPTTENLILNGGFEEGATSWTYFSVGSGVMFTNVFILPPEEGAKYFNFLAIAYTGAFFYQDFAVPFEGFNLFHLSLKIAYFSMAPFKQGKSEIDFEYNTMIQSQSFTVEITDHNNRVLAIAYQTQGTTAQDRVSNWVRKDFEFRARKDSTDVINFQNTLRLRFRFHAHAAFLGVAIDDIRLTAQKI